MNGLICWSSNTYCTYILYTSRIINVQILFCVCYEPPPVHKAYIPFLPCTTQVMTVFHLIEAGHVKSWDDPLTDYCPKFSIKNSYDIDNVVTLRYKCCHSKIQLWSVTFMCVAQYSCTNCLDNSLVHSYMKLMNITYDEIFYFSIHSSLMCTQANGIRTFGSTRPATLFWWSWEEEFVPINN